MTTPDDVLKGLYDETLVGNAPRVLELTEEGLALGMEPQTLLFEALIPSLEEVGARFERGDFFVPEMLIAGRAMAGAMERLRPLLAETGVETVGKFLMGTVKGDVHDIGKNLVNIMLEGAGFEVIDLGVQVAPEKFVAAIEEHHPDIVGFSAFLTTTMPMFKANINALEKAGLRDQVVVMVGGAPVTQEYADAVGADGYAADASACVKQRQGPAPQAPRDGQRMTRREPLETASPQRHQGGGDRPRPPLLHHRRAHQPDRPPDLPGAAARRRLLGDRARRQGPGRGRCRRARHQHGRAARPTSPSCWPRRSRWSSRCTDLPICIDSSVVEALEAGLSVYQGRALVNSITAEDDRMAAILPLVKKYDAAIIALPNDHDEIPMEADKRLDLTAKIIRVATTEYGIAQADIVIDPLAMPIGADTGNSLVTMECMRRIRDEFGVNMTCGASNVSFGMPDRHTLDSVWLPMAMTAGLTSAIMDARTPQIVEAVKAADVFLNHDDWGMAWIAAHRAEAGRRHGMTS